MNLAYPFFFGYLLDLILGDPQQWPHPVRWMGRLCRWWETRLYRPSIKQGVLFWIAVMSSLMAGVLLLLRGLSLLPFGLGLLGQTYLIYASIATRSLHKESRLVEKALEESDLTEARQRLSRIVGRRTDELSAPEIRRAVLETVAENLSDGVVAPIFYGILFGIPGMLAYKAVNTMDSMVGYRTQRYTDFGCAAARMDDLANFVPARFTAFLMLILTPILGMDGAGARRILRRDRRKASSPNAGWPEAVLAGALNVRLGGPNTYFGRLVEKPFIGDPHRVPDARDYDRAIRLLYGTSLLMTAIAVALFLMTGARAAGMLMTQLSFFS